MNTSNLWIIDEIFLKLSELKKNKTYFKKPTDFTRNSVFTFELVFSLIANLPRMSLALEVNKSIELFNQLYNNQKTGTKSGFCKARKKIKSELFACINNFIVELYYSKRNRSKIKKWKGFNLIAIDGSIIDMPNLDCLREKFVFKKTNREPIYKAE